MSQTLEDLLKKKSKKGRLKEWRGVAVTMTEEERRVLEEYAKRNFKSFSSLVREITVNYIQSEELKLSKK